ncbi:MAG: FtsX-like permease family protein [Acidimicrobiia bacterium]|nr:FtsX-like permease family protein [Acidimicrobiia bacterium]
MGPSDLAVQSDRAEEEGWSLGDTVTARFAETGLQELTIAALYDERQPAGPFTITTAGYEANFEDQFDVQVYVRFVDGTDLEAARGQLEEILEAYPNGELQDQAEFRESLESQINQLLALVFVLLALAVIIALIGIANSITLSVYERTREIGLVRAVGMTRRQVRSSVRWESVIVALLGTALGLVVAVFFGWALVQALRDEGFEVFQVPFGQLAVIVVVAGLAGVLAAVGPARRAAKLDVLRAVTTE